MTVKVALIYPYFKTPDNRNQMLFNPLGIAQLAAELQLLGKENVDAVIYDCTFKEISEVLKEITEFHPDIIAFYSMISQYHNIQNLMKILKALIPNAYYICGGPHATLFPLQFAQDFDIIFRGEADVSFPRFIRDFEKNEKSLTRFLINQDLTKYPGIFLGASYGNKNEPAHHITEQELQSLPQPIRDNFDHNLYQKFWLNKTGYKVTTILMTRGCPYNCDFCSKPIFGNVFRKRTLEDIFTEIRTIKHLGYNYLWIGDDSFTLDITFLHQFCRGMIDQHLDLKWSCLSRVKSLDPNTVRLMKLAGCDKVFMGIESGNDLTLKLMKKHICTNDVRNAVRMYKQEGIKTAGFFIIGYPGETWESIEDTFRFAQELNLDEVSFNVPYPLPGSPLFERVTGFNVENDWTFENETRFLFDSQFDASIIEARIKRFFDESATINRINKVPVVGTITLETPHS